MKQLAGVLAPVITPFDEGTGDLAIARFLGNVRAHLGAGLNGIVIAGSTGEAALLSEDERRTLIAAARGAVPDDRLLLAGIGGESTRITVQRASEAAERGADAVLVVAPHYYGSAMTTPALREHYQRVADASPVPVVLYNIPRYMHFALDAALVAELAAHENIVGIKDSSGDAALLDSYLAAQSPSFSVLTGSGAGLYAALGRGARGGILAVSLFAIDETTGANSAALLYQAWRAGRRDAAARYQERLTPLSREIVAGMGVPGVKAALDEVGLAGGPPRPPLQPLGAPDRERLVSLLQSAATPA